MIEWLRARRSGRQHPPTAAVEDCPHCAQRAPLWPAALEPCDGPLVCTACGGWVTERGARLTICPICAGPCEAPHRDHRDALAGCDEPGLAGQLERLIGSAYRVVEPSGLDRYVRELHQRLDLDPPPSFVWIDTGDPLIAALPGGRLAVALGLVAALEDEAQLAFILAREAALRRAGWPLRRFAYAEERAPSWWRRWRGTPELALRRALELSLKLGFGPAAEASADRDALAVLVRCEYEPTAAARALRRLERAALVGRGARFLLAADRATWLDEAQRGITPPAGWRSNREVYRRVVGGFAVFATHH